MSISLGYIHKPVPSPEVCNALQKYDVLTQKLLHARNIVTEEDAEIFLKKEYEKGLHDPFLLPDMQRAVTRILSAISHNERIGIFSDYDCDGIPGGVLLHDFFTTIGYTNFYNYIPHRHEEGYGLSIEAIDHLKEEGVVLLITVDCGIASLKEVSYANEKGVDVIVTDHHEPGEELPEALAIINPKRKDNEYPFSGLCGTGIAFKLVTAVSQNGNFLLKPGQEKWLLDLVGIATVADMVPLQGENRIFAHYGMIVLRQGRRLGLQHLFRIMRTPLTTITEDDIGFMIAPRINAASRMGNPRDAFLLLASRDESEAGTYAAHLETINTERKGVVAAMVKEVHKKLSLRNTIDPVIVIGDPSWRPSLVGLVANTLVEEYQRPVFVWGRDGRNILKGSCRAPEGVSVFLLMQHAASSFLEFGGHHRSGGFAVKEDTIHSLGESLNSAYGALSQEGNDRAVSRHICVDATLRLSDVTPSLVATLARFGPYGEGNPKPVFLFENIVPYRVEIFGKQKAHTKLLFRDGVRTLSAIGFFSLPENYSVLPTEGKPVHLLAHVEESFFMGRRETRLRIVSLEKASDDEAKEKYILEE